MLINYSAQDLINLKKRKDIQVLILTKHPQSTLILLHLKIKNPLKTFSIIQLKHIK